MRRLGISLPLVLLVLVASACRTPWLELASRDGSGGSANGSSTDPALSADGRYVAFSSLASDLVPGDTNGASDVFVRDLHTGSTELVSVGAGGAPADGASFGPSISADGRRVVFHSSASNLAPDVPGREDVFLWDRATHTTVSPSAGFDPGDESGVGAAAISGDGSTVWFPGGARFGAQVAQGLVVYDVVNGSLSFPPSPWEFPFFFDGMDHGSVSFDGRYAAVSLHTLPAPEVTSNVYRVDRVGGTVETVPEFGGLEVASPCWSPTLSADGGRMAFVCTTSAILPGAPDAPNVYARDLPGGPTFGVSIDRGGQLADGSSDAPSLSSDGSQIAFASSASDLVIGDSNGTSDVFVRDVAGAVTARVSLDLVEVAGDHGAPSLGAGDLVAFTTDSDAIVPGDADGTYDVLVRSVHTPRVVSATPSLVAPGSTVTVTVVGDYFRPGATVEVTPGADVSVESVLVVSSTELELTVEVDPQAEPGLRTVVVTVPGPGVGIGGRTGSTGDCPCLTVS